MAVNQHAARHRASRVDAMAANQHTARARSCTGALAMTVTHPAHTPSQEVADRRRRFGPLYPLLRAVTAAIPGPRVRLTNGADFPTVAK